MLMLTDLLSSPLFWAGIMLLFAFIELGTAGFVAGFLAMGSFLTMFLVNYGVATTTSGILLGFVLSTLLAVAVLWYPFKKLYTGRKTTDEEEGLVAFIGNLATVVSDTLTTSGGKVRVHGTNMEAVLATGLSVTSLPSGARVLITARDHEQRLVVMPAE